MGKYHCTIDLLFDWFGLVCFANKNKNCQLSHSWLQTSQTGGQQYNDTSPFSIPCYNQCCYFTFIWLGRRLEHFIFERKPNPASSRSGEQQIDEIIIQPAGSGKGNQHNYQIIFF